MYVGCTLLKLGELGKRGSVMAPCGVLADVGGQHLVDLETVKGTLRIAACLSCDLLQPVDSTELDLKLAAAELVNCAGEPFRDLALAGQGELLAELVAVGL